MPGRASRCQGSGAGPEAAEEFAEALALLPTGATSSSQSSREHWPTAHLRVRSCSTLQYRPVRREGPLECGAVPLNAQVLYGGWRRCVAHLLFTPDSEGRATRVQGGTGRQPTVGVGVQSHLFSPAEYHTQFGERTDSWYRKSRKGDTVRWLVDGTELSER